MEPTTLLHMSTLLFLTVESVRINESSPPSGTHQSLTPTVALISTVAPISTQKNIERRVTHVTCSILKVNCPVEVVIDEKQLRVYKVITALLSCVLLVLLLLWFSRPTVRALQKRLSDRRKSRWIGPKQSQSVSFHRGRNGETIEQKTSPYPALENLLEINSDFDL